MVANSPHRIKVEDLPLPDGYREDPGRRCNLNSRVSTVGYSGLAWAILLRAIEDGCDPEWLREICRRYGIQVDPSIFDKIPYRKVGFDMRFYWKGGTKRVYHHITRESGGHHHRLILSWFDALVPIHNRLDN